jgi:hypothetical protein
MRHAGMIVAIAISCLASVCDSSAKAAVFDFSFGSGVTGTFITGGAAPGDPGYDLVTGLTFNLLSWTAAGVPFSYTNVVGSDFSMGAAFNPTTGAFVNTASGYLDPTIGSFTLTLDKAFFGSIQNSFSKSSTSILGEVFPAPYEYVIIDIKDAPLVITPAPTAAAVPEASTWAMMLLGFVSFAVRRWRLGAVPVARFVKI